MHAAWCCPRLGVVLGWVLSSAGLASMMVYAWASVGAISFVYSPPQLEKGTGKRKGEKEKKKEKKKGKEEERGRGKERMKVVPQLKMFLLVTLILQQGKLTTPKKKIRLRRLLGAPSALASLGPRSARWSATGPKNFMLHVAVPKKTGW